MSSLNTKNMVGVPVRTRGGQEVGKALSFDFEPSTGRLLRLHVKTHGLVVGLMAKQLVIAWTAILDMTPERVIVTDAAVPVIEAAAVNQPQPIVPAPSFMQRDKI